MGILQTVMRTISKACFMPVFVCRFAYIYLNWGAKNSFTEHSSDFRALSRTEVKCAGSSCILYLFLIGQEIKVVTESIFLQLVVSASF